MRVVFDTNVLVSALVFSGGQGEQALNRILDETDRLVISKAILDELLGVLGRKFKRDAEELSRVAVFLSDVAETVKPRRKLGVLRDEPDNRILECAVEGRAELIVTGDAEMLELKAFRGISILRLRDYLKPAPGGPASQ